MRSVFILVTLFLFCSVATAEYQLAPIDQGTQNPEFLSFRNELVKVVAARDAQRLLDLVADDIDSNFGGTQGKEAFAREWFLDVNARQSPIWDELAKVLKLGGAFRTNGSFEAPYVSATWPRAFDPYEFKAIIGAKVRIRKEPDASSPVLYTATYEILQGETTTDRWTVIYTPDGTKGYVSSNYVRSALDYRAHFAKDHQGRWLMTVFIAGD